MSLAVFATHLDSHHSFAQLSFGTQQEQLEQVLKTAQTTLSSNPWQDSSSHTCTYAKDRLNAGASNYGSGTWTDEGFSTDNALQWDDYTTGEFDEIM